jgi:hypothetical protein
MWRRFAYYGAAVVMAITLGANGFGINTGGYWLVMGCLAVMLVTFRS